MTRVFVTLEIVDSVSTETLSVCVLMREGSEGASLEQSLLVYHEIVIRVADNDY